MRLDKAAQHAKVLSSINRNSRSGRHRRKEKALTRGDLPTHALSQEKSAEAIVPVGNEPRYPGEDSRDREGLNVTLFQYILDAICKPLVNENKGACGEKSVYTDM